ncbi:MAG: hypothetical protein ACPG32_04500 [Akkermansiaceae bacterium]
MKSIINQWPQVMPTKMAHEYVGGVKVWEELLGKYSEILKPFRTTPQGWQSWHKEIIDNALRAAQMDGKLNQKKAS